MILQKINNASHSELPYRKLHWVNIPFIASTHLIALIGIPLYAIFVGFTWADIGLAFFFYLASGLAITVGYHRMLSHVTFKGGAILRFLTVLFGSAAFEMSVLDWCSQHRDHHSFTDTDRDPYNSKKGFFYAHMGWLLFWKHTVNHSNVKDLQQYRLFRHQHIYYLGWAIGAGILLPLALGALFGSVIGAFLLAVCGRITFVYQGTFCINSVCHYFGKLTYDARGTAKDHWATALVTFGEGYHNFHHRFPRDYRNGIRWWQFDPSKWFIVLMKQLHLATDLYKTSRFKILSAKITAETRRAEQKLDRLSKWKGTAHVHEIILAKYESLQKSLHELDLKLAEYKQMKRNASLKSRELLQNTLQRVKERKRQFKQAHREWKLVLRSIVYLPKVAPILT